MIRSTNTARFQTQTPHSNPSNIPSIRLISATPSAAGSSADGSMDTSQTYNRSLEDAWAALAPSALAPKAPAAEPRKRLVPKKSKLSLLGMGIGIGSSASAAKERARDFSDITRRIGADLSAAGGFEIYVDPEAGDELGEVVVVKKKKSRAALDGMAWGAKEVTNVPKAPRESKEGKDGKGGLLKVKTEEGQKWWSIGRGRKDSKEEKKDKENKISHKRMWSIFYPTESELMASVLAIEYIRDPQPRSKSLSLAFLCVI
jgi:serine/arginine repetitive matrix protein 2